MSEESTRSGASGDADEKRIQATRDSNGRDNSSGADGDDGREGSRATKQGGGMDTASTEAYIGGRKLVAPTWVHANRDTYVTINHVAGPTRVTPGPVPSQELAALRELYVPVDGYERLEGLLIDRRLVVLAGASGSGRAATAIHILDSLSGGQVRRLDGRGSPLSFIDQIRSGHGYCSEIGESLSRLTRSELDALAERLHSEEAYCVLVVEPARARDQHLADYWFQCPLPDIGTVLRRYAGSVSTPTLAGEAESVLDEIVSDGRVRKLLGESARPIDAVRIAPTVAAYARGELDWAGVEVKVEQILFEDRFDEWFADLGAASALRADRLRRIAALRISVAVFDGQSRHVAETAADDLAAQLAAPALPPKGPPTKFPPPPAGRYGQRLLDTEDALSVLNDVVVCQQAMVPYGRSRVPGQIVSYVDQRIPGRLLRWVWTSRYGLRAPLIEWLNALSRDGRQSVHLRAAQAAGVFAVADFSFTLRALIEPAASTADRSRSSDFDSVSGDDAEADNWKARRLFAAVAMDAGARNPDLRRPVAGILRSWRRSADPALRSSAALALGFDHGARDPEYALEEFRVLGTPGEAARSDSAGGYEGDGQVFLAAASGVTSLAMIGAHHQVFNRLRTWIRSPRRSLRVLAAQVIVNLMESTVSSVGEPETGVDDLVTPLDRSNRGEWPVLVALHHNENPLGLHGAEFVRTLLRSPDRKVAFEVVSDWMRSIDLVPSPERGERIEVLLKFLLSVATDDLDRARLRGTVRALHLLWEDPLSARTAEELWQALGGDDSRMDRGGLVI